MDAEAFASEVLVPLATGAPLTVRAPLDADDVTALCAQKAALPGIAEIAEARRASVAHFLRDAPAPPLEDDAIRIAAAVHNLCWVLGQARHEENKGALARVAAYSAQLCRLPAPADELALCARHALAARVRTLTRRDVRVRFWAGQREFLGEEPPRRLLRWQRVRRVREEHTTVDLFAQALAGGPTRAIVVALLRCSPLTDLLDLERADPPIDLGNAVAWLRSVPIARAVADEYLRRGLPVIEGPLTLALVALYNASSGVIDGPTRREVAERAATATAFHSHLHLLDVIARPPRDREGHLQIIRGYAQGRERTCADGFGLHAAAERLGLGRPADLARDRALRDNADAYAAACAELVGPRRLQELLGLVSRGAGERARVS